VKLTLILLILTLLLAVSCSRFEHDFDPPEDFEAALFNPLQAALDSLTATNIAPVMDFFADEYLHNGITKAGREEFLQSLYSVSTELIFTVDMANAEFTNDNNAIATWNLKVYSDSTKALLADSTFVNDRLIKRNGKWLLMGNGISGGIQTQKQRIIIEYFTFVGCPNCPVVANHIRQLQASYPTQLSYVEYHASGELSQGMAHNDLMMYYSAFPNPVSVVQGNTKLTGSTPDVLSTYTQSVALQSEVDASVKLENFSYQITGNQIDCSIKVNTLVQDFDLTNVKLRYVLLKKTWDFANPSAEAHHNVALAKGSIDLATQDLSQPISFSLTKEIPADAAMLVFVQKVPSTFNSDATIYNGIEVPISQTK